MREGFRLGGAVGGHAGDVNAGALALGPVALRFQLVEAGLQGVEGLGVDLGRIGRDVGVSRGAGVFLQFGFHGVSFRGVGCRGTGGVVRFRGKDARAGVAGGRHNGHFVKGQGGDCPALGGAVRLRGDEADGQAGDGPAADHGAHLTGTGHVFDQQTALDGQARVGLGDLFPDPDDLALIVGEEHGHGGAGGECALRDLVTDAIRGAEGPGQTFDLTLVGHGERRFQFQLVGHAGAS